MIQAVLFDLDNTLYSYDEAHEAAFRALTGWAREHLGLESGDFERLHREANRILKARCGGGSATHNRLIRCQILLEGLGLPLRHAPEMAALYWSTLLAAARPYPGTREGLALLREQGYTVGVGTNMTADRQFEKLEKLGLIELVDFLVTSEEAGAEKPDARLFALCAEKAHCPASDCVYVGDSLESDILGALRSGMRAVWFCPQPRTEAAPTGVPCAAGLTELPALLSELGREGA